VFARDMDMTVNSPVWGLVRKPGAASAAAERAAS
jgi:hypothetical protein